MLLAMQKHRVLAFDIDKCPKMGTQLDLAEQLSKEISFPQN